ncbi:2-amino-4-hydroxy-6-hydroxymethyldihydropteridine diphosphokinase [Luteimonas sp. FCS-9]|uniref:2-amino-4-hydroxy-6- hydroxymethyldihydropteridine diphosphokinase n=1 Tax=Luteimonas sp. FCS-9 TaxID=1547516 RepID=UPI00063E8664|nr:2-amino-4-hydroxy-6-hydroxymethyldihydropteridine diphosphokinase [Luteimonas sp. FCS-9]KLI97616.1 2-amino-4-hydroxy-6-hydroxymethyldihydropteridine pyrophosphokinase [Luteimonas sp. FCS-9]
MAIACLSLGSNLDPEHHLRAAVDALRARFPSLVVSPTYRFPAVGYAGADFLNAAATIETELSPEALNAWLHALEDAHGRDRSGPRYSDRTLDIDIVLYADRILAGEGNLRIPRDELRHAFVLKPLAEIAPDLRHPVDGRTLAQLWAVHPDRDTAFETIAIAEPIGAA